MDKSAAGAGAGGAGGGKPKPSREETRAAVNVNPHVRAGGDKEQIKSRIEELLAM